MLTSIFLFSFFVTGTLLTPSSSTLPTSMQPISFTEYIHHIDPTPMTLQTPPAKKILPNLSFAMQSYNNCGPASLSMTLRHYGHIVSQEALAETLRPHNNEHGIQDDKSVSLEEMAQQAKEYDLIPYHRPNGSLKQMKQFLSYDMPIITKEWLNENEDIGHYRLLRGYDDITQEIIQDDSYEGPDIQYSYARFSVTWSKFNNEYLVLVPKEKRHIAEAILGADTDPAVAWEHAASDERKKLAETPDDLWARFNLSVIYYNQGKYEQSVEEFEKVEHKLPARGLWYQIEPIQAYFMLGNDKRVFQLTDDIINNNNPAFSELYLIRGEIYKKQGNLDAARAEFEKAVYYNKNMKEATEALNNIQ
mgnify:CR=1 FL=1